MRTVEVMFEKEGCPGRLVEVASNNLPMGVAKARYVLYMSLRAGTTGWRVGRVRFVTPAAGPSITEREVRYA